MTILSSKEPSQGSTSQPIVVPPLTVEEEDHIILARITNDERPLRRVIKKFHNYTSLSHAPVVPSVVPSGGPEPPTVEDAREAFLVELATFQLSLKKSAMICEAEARQVEEYQRERQRIDDEHGTLRGQIEQLKIALENAQILRRRKIDYDMVAEKVNTLPSREELERSIKALENDMFAIRSEHDTQNRIIQGQKSALDGIIFELGSLRFMARDRDVTSVAASPGVTPILEGNGLEAVDGIAETGSASAEATQTEEEKEEGEEDKPFTESAPGTVTDEPGEDDIEMGEVEEDPRDKGRKKREDLEEGEASDASSALSEPPED